MIESKFARLISNITFIADKELNECEIINIRKWVEECFLYDEEAKVTKREVTCALLKVASVKFDMSNQKLKDKCIDEVMNVTTLNRVEATSFVTDFK